MTDYKHLKERSYYEDLYDRHTVEMCRFHEQRPKLEPKVIKTNRSMFRVTCNLKEVILSLIMGDRYYRRSRTIEEWMARDRERDRIFADATAPKPVCVICEKGMEVMDKDLVYFDVKIPYVDWTFGCKGCGSLARFKKGVRHDDFPWQCPKCKRRMASETVHKNHKYTTTDSCECGYSNVSTLDLGKYMKKSYREKDPDPKEEQRYREDKLRFCLTPEAARHYANFDDLQATLDGILNRKGEEGMPARPQFEELTLQQLKKRLQTVLPNHGYALASFGKPKMEEQVSFALTLTDERERKPFTAKKELRKVLEETLRGTNWEFKKNAVQERLGVMKVSLRTFEQILLK